MSARGIVTGLAETAVSAVRHPFRTTGRVVGGAKVVVATGTSVAGSAAKSATSHLHPGKKFEDTGTPESQPEEKPTPEESEEQSAPESQATQEPVEVEPQVVLREPGPPPEPPIDVVGEALAAEDQEPEYGGHATEPKATTRDEEHGEAALQRAEAEEIAEEVAEAFPAGEVGIETPVGTTGADVGHNPDTAEADLQQPGTPPLVDDPTVKAVASESKTGRKAAKSKKS